LSLDYKVSAGEGRLRVLVAYDDAAGRPRTSTLEVTAGDPSGTGRPGRETCSPCGRDPRA